MSNQPPNDKYDLGRFVTVQMFSYTDALSEIRQGQKRSHWMWYIFPQLRGLGASQMAHEFGITSEREAVAYLQHEILGPRLLEISQAALEVEGRTALQIFGDPDCMKLRSCATLFAEVSPADSVFHQLLQKYFDGEKDLQTLDMLDRMRDGESR